MDGRSAKGNRVFDCFIFFNELDLLDIRLEECFESVDYFVICEATRTFRGAPKPLLFAENRDRFAKYLEKIRYVTVDDLPSDGDAWRREFRQRNELRRGFQDAQPNDIIIIADCDEIISPKTIDRLREDSGYFMLDMPMYQFYINMMAARSGWNKPYAFTYALNDKVGDLNDGRRLAEETYQRFSGENHRVEAAGWHFTFLGGAPRVVEKIKAYSHAEAWQRSMLLPGKAYLQMLLLKDVGGGRFLEYCDIDSSYPATIRRRKQELTELGLIKEASTRISELVTVVAQLERDKERILGRNCYLEKEAERLSLQHPADVNVALNKPSTQSSTSRWSIGSTVIEDAKGGNDGQITDLYGFHTESEESPWWLVDLMGVYLVHAIRIFNRQDEAYRLRHFSVLCSTDGIHWTLLHRKSDDRIFGERLEPYDISLQPARSARYVKIQLDGTGFLHFHECLVYGHLAGCA